jgi:2-polyprenyl-6-methoxyphenol hydroxylase-like FAD-dependent oxidoreductase
MVETRKQLMNVRIIGAGPAGLACPRRLHAAGQGSLICEACGIASLNTSLACGTAAAEAFLEDLP